MRAGLLRHRVAFQSPSRSVDTNGYDIETWSTVATVYADVRSAGGGERNSADRIAPEATHTIRYRAKAVDVTPGMRAVFCNEAYNVEWVEKFDHRDIVRIAHVKVEPPA